MLLSVRDAETDKWIFGAHPSLSDHHYQTLTMGPWGAIRTLSDTFPPFFPN